MKKALLILALFGLFYVAAPAPKAEAGLFRFGFFRTRAFNRGFVRGFNAGAFRSNVVAVRAPFVRVNAFHGRTFVRAPFVRVNAFHGGFVQRSFVQPVFVRQVVPVYSAFSQPVFVQRAFVGGGCFGY